MLGVVASHYDAGGGGGGGGFKPTDIPNLLVWFSAEAVTGLTDNTQMNSWSDLSGNGNHATAGAAGTTKPLWRSTAGAAGGPAVQFANSGWFTHTNVLTGLAAGEVMLTAKADTTTTAGTLMIGSTSGGTPHYPFSDGKVYENWGRNARPGYTPTMSVASWRRYNIWSAANDWAALLDETTQQSTTSNTVSWSAPIIGAASTASPSSDARFDGHIGGFVIYGRKLTTTERADLVAFFTANPSGGTP